MLNNQLSERQKAAAEIIAHPENFKQCNACLSIWRLEPPVCKICNNYSFDIDKDEIIRQAKILSEQNKQTVLLSDLY